MELSPFSKDFNQFYEFCINEINIARSQFRDAYNLLTDLLTRKNIFNDESYSLVHKQCNLINDAISTLSVYTSWTHEQKEKISAPVKEFLNWYCELYFNPNLRIPPSTPTYLDKNPKLYLDKDLQNLEKTFRLSVPKAKDIMELYNKNIGINNVKRIVRRYWVTNAGVITGALGLITAIISLVKQFF
jgi:hypothetical protein